jgi:hypothetical protein
MVASFVTGRLKTGQPRSSQSDHSEGLDSYLLVQASGFSILSDAPQMAPD